MSSFVLFGPSHLIALALTIAVAAALGMLVQQRPSRQAHSHCAGPDAVGRAGVVPTRREQRMVRPRFANRRVLADRLRGPERARMGARRSFCAAHQAEA